MKTATIDAAALAKLAAEGGDFRIFARAEMAGWVIYVHAQQGERALLDLEGKAAAVFDALSAAEQHLQTLGVEWFEVRGQHKADYEEWLRAEVQEAIDDPSPSVPHEEAMRRIRAAIREK